MEYDEDMRNKTIAVLMVAVAFAGAGFVVSAQQKPAAKTSAANTVIVYKSPT
jgi:hypothetical protein